MPESLSDRYAELLSGNYDCTDRIVLNAYFRMGHTPGGFRVWWRTLTGSEEALDNAHLMRMAGRFSRRLHGYAKAEGIPLVHCQAGDILERLMDALSCIDQFFLADSMLEDLPAPSSVGKTKVGGIDLNKARMRWVAEALIARCVSPSESQGFTASELARQVRLLSNQSESEYGPRRAAYDLKKLRAKNIVQRIGQTRRYQSTPSGLRAMVALVVLRNKAIKPLLAAAHRRRKSRGAQNPRTIDNHYETIRTAMQGVFDELGLAA